MSYLRDEIEGRLDYAQGPERVFSALVATSAVDYADRVSVTLPGTDGGQLRWEDVRWMPRYGSPLPQRGDECVVVMDENTELWIVAWWPQAPVADPFGWKTFTPTLTALGGGLSIGTTPTRVGSYLEGDQLVVYKGQITTGTGFNPGSGNFLITLPVAANTAVITTPRLAPVLIQDTSLSNQAHPIARISDATHFDMGYTSAYPVGTFTAVTGTAPWTWADGDVIKWYLIYGKA